MNEALRSMLQSYERDVSVNPIHALREIIQEIALLGLWRGKFFEHGAFYGGTALRILYALDRFSEDLDFSLLLPNQSFDMQPYLNAVERELLAFGFQVRTEIKEKRPDTSIQSAFVKANTLESLLVISASDSVVGSTHAEKLLKIKVEIDTNPPSDFRVESKYLLKPFPFAVRTYSLPDLFAGKMHAILCRKWRNRVKGRDWYDLVWFLANHPRLHLAHLEQRMRQSGHYLEEAALTQQKLLTILHTTIERLNINQAKQDVLPFVKDPLTIDVWSREFFISILSRIIIE
jgi:predicted nucleotidyltransferase component of viral defense system